MNHLPLDVRVPIEPDNPSIVRDEDKCIKCGMCKNVCTQDIGVHGTYIPTNPMIGLGDFHDYSLDESKILVHFSWETPCKMG